MLQYYSRRAREYDRVYERAERQSDLAELRELVAEWTAGHRVLELACGTGYWTEVIAPHASHVVATDASAETLEVARERSYGGEVELRIADAFKPLEIDGDFTAGLAGFWLSHVARREIAAWLAALTVRLGRGAPVVLFDNRYVEGSSTPVSRVDERGDGWQERRLDDGSVHEIRKNFFEEKELRSFVEPLAASVELRTFRYYWALTFTARG